MTINCKGQLIDLKTPKIMGILNLTPDSFYDGGTYSENEQIITQVAKMLSEGATFIDVGAYSSRPGAAHVSEKKELLRITPVIDILIKEFPDIILSIDTFRSEIAKICIDKGAAIINDISAGELDNNMFSVIAKHQVPYIMMHMKGTPKNMQKQTDYNNLIEDILYYFSEKIAQARNLCIKDIIIDPGFGFAKTLEQNFELLHNLEALSILDTPSLIGISRKSMIHKTLKTTAAYALNGTTALNMYSLNKGASILRVHDVKEAMECITLTKAMNAQND